MEPCFITERDVTIKNTPISTRRRLGCEDTKSIQSGGGGGGGGSRYSMEAAASLLHPKCMIQTLDISCKIFFVSLLLKTYFSL